jgi:hypothetical protein
MKLYLIKLKRFIMKHGKGVSIESNWLHREVSDGGVPS